MGDKALNKKSKPSEEYLSEMQRLIQTISEYAHSRADKEDPIGLEHYFAEAVDTREHPVIKANKKIRSEYFTALKYIVEKAVEEANCTDAEASELKKYTDARLHLYQTQLSTKSENTYMTCLQAFAKPYRGKYRYMLICDAALILLEPPLVQNAAMIIKPFLSFKQQKQIDCIISLLNGDGEIEKRYICITPLVRQYRANKVFFSKKEKRMIVTANISAGKSTLINALIGKHIARTAQDVCTGNVCYLFNKAYEDDNIHLSAGDLNLKADKSDLTDYDWNGQIMISSYFAGTLPDMPRVCMIDTPGVDAALYKKHIRLTHKVLLSDSCDTVIYVVAPTRLGTDAEKKHLKWVAKNVKKDKVIFVLNKLDNYQEHTDSIKNSLDRFREDLLEMGFENPVICPISAYFSYLIKLKMTGQALSEDETDEYDYYSKKFMRSSYDLSRYYGVECLPGDSEEITLSKRVGLYGLEKIIFGGK